MTIQFKTQEHTQERKHGLSGKTPEGIDTSSENSAGFKVRFVCLPYGQIHNVMQTSISLILVHKIKSMENQILHQGGKSWH